MKTSTKMLFATMTIMSTIMVMSSTSWINMWMGLEINLMSFIPLMSENKNSTLAQGTMMYFLTQSLASMLLIMVILTNKYIMMDSKSQIIKMMITSTMMIKMGMPPFHMWFPEVSKKISWLTCFTLMTWQKIAPMHIMSMVIEMNKTILYLICLSSLVGGIGGINQTCTRKMMAYSSINHMSWMITCAATFKKSWTMYLALYSMMMLMFSMIMYSNNIMYINQMNIFSKTPTNKIIIISMMLSMAGIPPFLGFLPKWMSIQYMLTLKEFTMIIIMMLSTLITSSYYLRMSSSMNLIMSHSQKWMFELPMNMKMPTMTLALNMALPMVILSMSFY